MTRRTVLVVVVVVGSLVVAGAAEPATAARGSRPAADCSFPYEASDATGTAVRVDAEPSRVVTLNPSAAQTMWEIGAREKVVGLTRYAGYLEGADSRTNVSGASAIVVVERVVDLEPDLVLAPNATPSATVEQLRDAGVTVYRFPEAGSIEDVYAKTRTIGRLVGECEGADETVAWMRDRVDTARTAADGQPRPDVLYAFFGYTAGRGTFIHEVIEAAGGNNVAADYGVTGYRQLNPEVVVEADPDWVVRNSRDPTAPGGSPFNSTTAVREGQVVVVPIEHMNQPAPRVVHAVTTLAATFHPESYAAANATRTVTGTVPATDEPERRATTTRAPSTVTPGQVGFGTTTSVVALAVALVFVGGKRLGRGGR